MADTPTGNLTVERIALDSEGPCHAFTGEARECLVYALVGKIRVYANHAFLGTIGGRSVVTEPLAQVIRFPAGSPHTVTLVLDGFAADCLIASCDAVPNLATKLPYLHMNDAHTHTVGTGTHERLVTEVVTPPSFHLSCGETLNAPGTTSSWPPHASIEDVQLYQEGKTTWEECFYIVAPTPGKAVLYGIYPGNAPVNETITLTSGQIVPMPLYSHRVTAAPDSWLWYWWGYCGNALQKEYRKHSTDVLTYRK